MSEEQLRSIFPLFRKAFGESEVQEIFDGFLIAVAKHELGVRAENDLGSVFPMFVRELWKKKRVPLSYVELADLEWNLTALMNDDLDEVSERLSLRRDQVKLNPLVKLLKFEHDVLGWWKILSLDREGGERPPTGRQMRQMALLTRKPQTREILTLKADAPIAAVLESLSEDSMNQLELISALSLKFESPETLTRRLGLKYQTAKLDTWDQVLEYLVNQHVIWIGGRSPGVSNAN